MAAGPSAATQTHEMASLGTMSPSKAPGGTGCFGQTHRRSKGRMGAFVCVILVHLKGCKVHQSIFFSQAAIYSAGIERSNEELGTVIRSVVTEQVSNIAFYFSLKNLSLVNRNEINNNNNGVYFPTSLVLRVTVLKYLGFSVVKSPSLLFALKNDLIQIQIHHLSSLHRSKFGKVWTLISANHK